MNFFLPAWLERPGLAMMGLGQGGIGFKLRDEHIVGMRLPPRQINVEGQQRDQAHNRYIVRSRTNLPKLSPVHNVSL